MTGTTETISVLTLPITINPTDDQKVESAKYRVGCIQRYLDQTEGVPDSKMAEFRVEMRELALLLLKNKVFTEDDHAKALQIVGIGA